MAGKLKLFIVRKWILATSAKDALKKEKRYQADDIFVDDDWRKTNGDDYQSKAIGFYARSKKESKSSTTKK